MTVPTIFKACKPRPDILTGRVAEADFAADLAQVIAGKGTPNYADPIRFFNNTYPTRGIKDLLAQVCNRLNSGGGGGSIQAGYFLWWREVTRANRTLPRCT